MQPDYNQIPQPPQNSSYQPQAPQQLQPMTASQMKKNRGHGLGMIIILIVLALLLLATLVFGIWAYAERNDYKANADKKVNQAVAAAVKETETKKEAEFAEREKEPLTEYQGPAAFGSVKIKYPKTWSAFVTESDKASTPVNGYFHPNFVPGIQSDVVFALHLEILDTEYANELRKFDSDSKSGKVKVSPISLQGVTGARIDGELEKNKRGSVVLVPLRDKTLKLTTESEKFVGDFNDIILKNLVFSP